MNRTFFRIIAIVLLGLACRLGGVVRVIADEGTNRVDHARIDRSDDSSSDDADARSDDADEKQGDDDDSDAE